MLSTLSIGLPGWITEPVPPISCSARLGVGLDDALEDAPMIVCRIGAGTPQIVTRRHGPWASAVLNSETPFWAVQASQ